MAFQNLFKEFKHAFSIDEAVEPYTDVDNEFLEKFASDISKRKLTVPAILFLETFKPLNYIGNQAMVFFRPFVSIIFPILKYDKVSKILGKRESISKLIEILNKKRQV